MRSLKWYRDIEKSQTRNQVGFFKVEGRRAVEQIIASSPENIDEILLSEEYPKEFLGNAAPVRRLSSRQLGSLSSLKSSQGIIAIVNIPSGSYSKDLSARPGNRILVLEHVQDPGNVGTLIRTAAAFDFSGVILSDKSADPFSIKAVQASAGSLLSLWIRRSSFYMEYIYQLKEMGHQIIATSTRGTVKQFSSLEKVVIALGNEGAGLSDTLISTADHLFRIPINDNKVESLNVATCGAIAMYTVVS